MTYNYILWRALHSSLPFPGDREAQAARSACVVYLFLARCLAQTRRSIKVGWIDGWMNTDCCTQATLKQLQKQELMENVSNTERTEVVREETTEVWASRMVARVCLCCDGPAVISNKRGASSSISNSRL